MNNNKGKNSLTGYLIDPFNQTCTEVIMPNDNNTFEQIKDNIQCSIADVVRLGGETIMFIDDEGRCYDRGYQRWFKLAEHSFAGRAMLYAEDREGNTLDVNRSIEDIEKLITWLPEDYHEEPYIEFTTF